MKNKSVLLILFLVVAPLLSACNSKTSDQLQFLITYKADGTEAIKYGLFFDKDEITSSNFNLNLEKVGKVKDIAAGAVLINALFSIIIGLIIFLPKIIHLFF